MKYFHFILLFFLLLVAQDSNAQYSTPYYTVSFTPDNYTCGCPYDAGSDAVLVQDSFGKPIRVDVITYCQPPTGNYTKECSINLSSAKCYSSSAVSWQPTPPAISGDIPKTYCSDQKVNLSVPNAYGSGSYIWQYAIESGSFTTLSAFTNSTISVGLQDIPGATFGQNMYFRYYVAGCSPPISPVSGAYNFSFRPLTATAINKSEIKCVGSNDGSIAVTSFDRSLISGIPGEIIVATHLYNSPDPLSTPAYSSNGSLTVSGIAPGTYYVLLETKVGSITPCSAVTASTFFGPITFSNPTPLSASGSVTSNYNGSQISCPTASDGTITVNASGGTGTLQYKLNSGSFQSLNTFSGLGAGTYAIGVKDNNGCLLSSSPTVTITPPITLTISSSSKTDALCNGTSSGSITLNGSGGVGGYQYSKDNGVNYQASNLFNSLNAGAYQMKVRDLNGCESVSSTITISQPNLITTSSVDSSPPLCNGLSGTITVNGTSGGTAPYQYSRDGTNFQSNNIFTAVLSGTYTITVKDANNCTASAGSVTLSQPAAIGVTNAIVGPSCFGGNNGSITVTATNGVGALQYSRDGGATFQTSNIFNSGISSGAYSVVVKDANGCLSPTTIAVVSQPSAVSGTIATPPPFTCFNTGNSANLNLTPSGGTAGYTFAWNTGETTEDISITLGSSLSSNYSVTITDSKGCTTNRSIAVTQPSQLTSSAVSSNISCFGASNGSVDLTPSGGTAPYTFLWNTGAATEDLSGRAAGTYSVTVTDFNGCTSAASASVTEPTALSLTQGSTSNVSCNGLSNGSINLVASGGTGVYEYSKDGIVWQSASLISGLAASAYTLRLRDQNNCTAQLNVTITQPSVLSVSVSNIINAVCGQANGSAQSAGTGGTGAYTFVWRNSLSQIVSSSSSLINVLGGIYRVTITDQNGCTDFKDAAISSPNGPVAAINSVTGTSCSNTNDGRASISVSTGQAPYTIVWNNGETGLNPVALKPGTGVNIVTITDAANCATAQVVDVPSPSVLQVSTQNTILPTCPGGLNASAEVLAQGGTAPYTYNWNTGATSATLSNVAAGTYQITAQDSKSCTANFSATIPDKPPIAINVVTQTSPSCIDKIDGILSVSATGGNGSFTYLWNTGATSPTISAIAAGTYTVTVTDALSCTLQKQITLANPPPLALDLGPDRKICVGGSVTLSSPVDATSYLWISANGFTSNSKQVTLTKAGDYKLSITNANGCIAEDSFTLTTATDLLNADFLMAPIAHVGDTVVVIDITWPVPDGISWSLPSSTTLVEQTADFVTLVFNEEGKFPIRLTANLAQCQDEYSASIEILKRGDNTGGGTSGNSLIKSLTAFPNPTSENRINLKIELNEVAPVRIRLVSLEGNNIVTDFNADAKDLYEFEIQLEGVAKGIYFLLVDVRGEKRVVRIVVV
jgi:hypothetical protein